VSVAPENVGWEIPSDIRRKLGLREVCNAFRGGELIGPPIRGETTASEQQNKRARNTHNYLPR
jgi:hypothetical protein